uniref:Uncharacterized protein n=1 Tax=Oryza sativa subsp. japonica TaxID=39947 RepID=Q67WH2_ORYSJ|nr:hypothetical protein [Oryza sativa Japonica Group]
MQLRGPVAARHGQGRRPCDGGAVRQATTATRLLVLLSFFFLHGSVQCLWPMRHGETLIGGQPFPKNPQSAFTGDSTSALEDFSESSIKEQE